MKLLLSVALATLIVVVPVPAEAKTRPTQQCSTVKTVEYKHGRRIVTTMTACPQKVRPARLSKFNRWV